MDRARTAALEALRRMFGAGLDESELVRLVTASDEWEARPGEELVRAGQASRQGFVVLSGVAAILVAGVLVAQLGPGSCVWSAVGAAGDRTTVVAIDPMWLLMLPPGEQAGLLDVAVGCVSATGYRADRSPR